MGLTIGVDVGGTKIAAGVVDEYGTVLESARRATPSDGAGAVESAIASLITELSAGRAIESVGIGAAALVDAAQSRVVFAANIGWVEAPLRERIEALTGLPTVVENDANSAAWGEHRFGAGQGVADLVLVIIGTGVGGGVVVDGSLVRGFNGAAGEIGHVRVVPDGLPCGCGLSGCLEQYASGRALLRIARTRIAGDPASGSVLLGQGDGTPEGIEGIHVSQAAAQGDPLAVGVFAELGERLGQGLAELSAVLDPACFVLGGGVSESGDLLLNPTRDAYLRFLTVRGHRIPAEIRTATLGNSAGMVGAADLARTRSPR